MEQEIHQDFRPVGKADCVQMLLEEIAQFDDEMVFQALICAYLGHAGWLDLAEAVFRMHGYTPEEIRENNT